MPKDITDDNLRIDGGFRQERLESLAEWQRDETADTTTKEAHKLLSARLKSFMSAIKDIDIGYGEKGWYGVSVYLK